MSDAAQLRKCAKRKMHIAKTQRGTTWGGYAEDMEHAEKKRKQAQSLIKRHNNKLKGASKKK